MIYLTGKILENALIQITEATTLESTYNLLCSKVIRFQVERPKLLPCPDFFTKEELLKKSLLIILYHISTYIINCGKTCAFPSNKNFFKIITTKGPPTILRQNSN